MSRKDRVYKGQDYGSRQQKKKQKNVTFSDKKKQVEELRQAKAAEFTAFSECSNAEEYIDNGLFKASWST